jgi:hypothetical protein
MFKLTSLGFAVIAIGLVAATPASAAPPHRHQERHRHHEVHVDYSLDRWLTRHVDDHHAAHDIARFVRSVGGTARVVHGGDHYDVVYTCPHPRMRHFHEDRDAHRFARDLRRYGFMARVHH